MSLRPFRWCRCAYKVAAPVWPCFRPCSLQMVSRASLAAVSCPIICTPSNISPTSHLLVVFGGYCAVSVTGGVTIAVGAYQHTPVSTAATRWRGIAPRRAYLVSPSNNLRRWLAAFAPRPPCWRCPCVVLFAPVRGIAPRRG